jgi:hypothetical protein
VDARAYGGPGADYAQSVAVGPGGRIAVAGFFEQNADFDVGDAIRSLTSVGGTDAFVISVVPDSISPMVTVTDLSTNDSTPQLTGSVDDRFATVQVTVGGLTYDAVNLGNGNWELPDDTITSPLADGVHAIMAIVADAAGNESAAAGTVTIDSSTAVVGRHVFYNQSHFDGNDQAANAADDNAIATDRSALLPGGVATIDNYTSYSRGINGIMVDIQNLVDSGAIDAGQFEFRVGNSNDLGTWVTGPGPSSVTVREGAGVDGSDRVTLIWSDNAIEKQWLEITVKANAVTGLAAPDVFYFGNAVGDSGNSTTNTFVDGSDFAGARDNPRNFLNRAPVDFRWDYNRDSFVDGSDLAIARDHNTNFLTALRLLDLSSTAPQEAVEGAAEGEWSGRQVMARAWRLPSQVDPTSYSTALPDAMQSRMGNAANPGSVVLSRFVQPRKGLRQIDVGLYESAPELNQRSVVPEVPLSNPLETILDEIATDIDEIWFDPQHVAS